MRILYTWFLCYRPTTTDSSVRITASTSSPVTSNSSNSSERRSSSATRLSSSASHRHRDRANSSAHRHSTSSLNPPRIHSAHSSVTRNNDHTNASNSEDNTSSPSEGEFPRRRSTRRRNYLNRNQLHNALDLPQGYGKLFICHFSIIIHDKDLYANGEDMLICICLCLRWSQTITGMYQFSHYVNMKKQVLWVKPLLDSKR